MANLFIECWTFLPPFKKVLLSNCMSGGKYINYWPFYQTNLVRLDIDGEIVELDTASESDPIEQIILEPKTCLKCYIIYGIAIL